MNLTRIFQDKASTVTGLAVGLGPSVGLAAVSLFTTAALMPSFSFVAGGILSGLVAKGLLGYQNTQKADQADFDDSGRPDAPAP